MKRIVIALGFLLVGYFPAAAQTILQCYNSNTGFSTTQPCPGNKNTINNFATIATGNTFQTVLSANNNRASLTIENNNASDSCWLTFGTTAGGTKITAGNATKGESILLQGNGGSFQRYFPYVPADEFEATCASSSDTLYIDVQ